MKFYLKFTIILVGLVLGIGLFSTDSAHAAAAQMRVYNSTPNCSACSNYSVGGTYSDKVKARPGDTLTWRMFYNGTAATTLTVTFPNDLILDTNSTSVLPGSNAANIQSVDTHTSNWIFAPATVEIITFRTTVASGANLSSNHSLSVSFSTNGTPTTSDAATVITGPIVTAITPSSGSNSSPVAITSIAGHGFTAGASSPTVTVSLSDGTSLNMTGATVTDTLITGPNLSIPGLHAVGSFYVIVTTDNDGTDTLSALSNAAASGESVQYTVADGEPPVMTAAANTYNHATGILTLNFNETISVSATDLSKITLYDAAAAGHSLSLDTLGGATKSTANATAVTFTLSQSQINTISGWGVTAGNLYAQIAGNGIYDLSNNPLSNQGSRTGLNTWTKDTTAPTAAVTYTQGGSSVTSVKDGSLTITVTFSEPIATTPQIAIDQPGATDIAASNLTGSGATWTYTYTVNADSDGAAAVTLSSASDYANNALGTVTGNSFTIDRLGPSPAISNLSAAANGQTAVTLSWTPTYTASDFSTYKIYYNTVSGVTSANGTLASKDTSGYSGLGTALTNAVTVSGLTAATNYYAVIYICDGAGNCSTISNQASAQTNQNAIISVPVASGGGGSSGSSAPSTASSAGTITESGGTITTTLAGGTAATVTVPADSFTTSSTVSVSEATSAEKGSAPLASTAGVIIPNTVFSIQASSAFSAPVTLEFVYDPAQLGSIDPNTLSISYFSATDNKWVSLASSVNTTTHKVSAQTTHFTLFAITTVPPASDVATTETTPPPAETTPESGQVLGSTVGVYPNGTLLKAPDSPAVWQIANDEKHLIASGLIFKTNFKTWNQVVYLPSSRQLDLYDRGEDMKFAVNTLVKEIGKSDVYRVSANGGLQPIVSASVFKSRGYSFKDVIEVASNLLANYPRQAYIADASTLYSGELARVAVSGPQAKAVYYIDSGQAKLIPSRDIFDTRAFSLKRVRTINRDLFSQLAHGTDLNYPDGTLVHAKDSQKIYVIADGRKREVNPEDFKALLYRERNVKIISETQLAQLLDAGPVRVVQGDLHTASQ